MDTSSGGVAILDSSVNAGVGAANRFGLEVTSASGSPRIYGGGRMAAYANVQSGTQRFFLAQIDKASGGRQDRPDRVSTTRATSAAARGSAS